jgi:phytoene synthase
VREDLQGGRVYLPQETLDAHECQLILREDGTLDPQEGRLAAVLRSEAKRAESLYAEGLGLLPLLDWRSRGCCGALSGIYHALLGRIAADPHATFGARVSVPTSTKLAVAARALAPRPGASRARAGSAETRRGR